MKNLLLLVVLLMSASVFASERLGATMIDPDGNILRLSCDNTAPCKVPQIIYISAAAYEANEDTTGETGRYLLIDEMLDSNMVKVYRKISKSYLSNYKNVKIAKKLFDIESTDQLINVSEKTLQDIYRFVKYYSEE